MWFRGGKVYSRARLLIVGGLLSIGLAGQTFGQTYVPSAFHRSQEKPSQDAQWNLQWEARMRASLLNILTRGALETGFSAEEIQEMEQGIEYNGKVSPLLWDDEVHRMAMLALTSAPMRYPTDKAKRKSFVEKWQKTVKAIDTTAMKFRSEFFAHTDGAKAGLHYIYIYRDRDGKEIKSNLSPEKINTDGLDFLGPGISKIPIKPDQLEGRILTSPGGPAVISTAPHVRPPVHIYQWLDASGKVQITDQPPPTGAGDIKIFDSQPE